MNWLDIVLLVIVAASVVTSFRKGFSREVIGLISVLLALGLGIWFYGVAGAFLLPYVSSRSIANFAGFLIVFCVVVSLGSAVSWLVGRFLKMTGLSVFDHILGAGFGVLRGALISVALVMAIMAFSTSEKPPAVLAQSLTAPYVAGAARVFAAVAPHELKEGFRRTYDQMKTVWGDAIKKGIRGMPNSEKFKDEREI